MSRRTFATAFAAAAAMLATTVVPVASAGAEPEPEAVDVDRAVAVAIDHARASHLDQRVAAADVEELRVTDAYTSSHTGVTHVYLRQQRDGIDVATADMVVNVTAEGEILHTASRFVDGAADRGAAPALASAEIEAPEAAELAAEQLDLEVTEPIEPMARARDASRDAEVVLSDGGVSEEPIPARQVYLPVSEGDLRLAWTVTIVETSGEHAWEATVDAVSGELLEAQDLVDSDDLRDVAAAIGRTETFSADAASTAAVTTATDTLASETFTSMVPGHPSPTDGASYRVYPMPLESPQDGGRQLVVDPADPLSSPFGWHDVTGTPEPDYTRTRGNNVHAYTDWNNTNTPDPGSDPDGGPELVFDHPLDLRDHPHDYADAAVTNLFYWNNIIHDVLYRYGFDELSGNFQVNNFGRGGLGGDDVRAEAQDGGGMNNANFFTPPDGNRPRMQMYLWNANRASSLPNLVIIDEPSEAAGEYEANGAEFGPRLRPDALEGEMVLVDDGSEAPSTGCAELVDFPAGAIAVAEMADDCTAEDQATNAQAAGALALVLIDEADDPSEAEGEGHEITIPVAVLGAADGATIAGALPTAGGLATNPLAVLVDGDLDAGIIVHEYIHGLSNRLTGGPATSCLSGEQQMGEGWSDWYAKTFTALPGDSGPDPRGIGTYALRQGDRSEQGIRPTPYSTDLEINPATYGDIPELAVPHGVGYVWSTMLWEVYWALVNHHGFNPDLYADWSSGGNNLAMQLVTDGMKLQGCLPGFVDGRDAIVAADVALTGGDNQCRIWGAFAKRGLGYSAIQGLSSRRDITEAFDTHPDCRSGLDVTPEQVDVEVAAGAGTAAGVQLVNTAPYSGEALEWEAHTARTSCAQPEDLVWLDLPAETGSVPAASARMFEMDLDASALPAGLTVSGYVCLSDTRTDEAIAEIPVTLRVTGG